MKRSERIAELIHFAESTISKYEKMPSTIFNKGIIKNAKELILELNMHRPKGNKRMYGEKTVTLTIKVPESKKGEIRELFYGVLERYQQAYINSIKVNL